MCSTTCKICRINKLSPSYPQSYPQKGVTTCKVCSTTCKICSTPCKICSTKQSYPQVIPRVIPKKVLPTAKCAVPNCKICSTICKIRSTTCKIRSTTCKICSINLQNTQYQTKLSPSYPQSYPQWISHRKIDLKNKSKCFILT